MKNTQPWPPWPEEGEEDRQEGPEAGAGHRLELTKISLIGIKTHFLRAIKMAAIQALAAEPLPRCQ